MNPGYMNARLYEQPNKVEINYRKRTIEREINFYQRLTSQIGLGIVNHRTNRPQKFQIIANRKPLFHFNKSKMCE